MSNRHPRLGRRAAVGGLASLVVVAAFLLPGTRSASAAGPVFSDGFESGTMSLWSGSKGVVLQHTTVHAGSWAAKVTSTGAGKTYATANLSNPVPELTLSSWIDLQSVSTTVVLLRLRSSTGTGLAWVGLHKNGRLFEKAGGTTVTSTTTLPKNAWHRLALHLALRQGTDVVDVSLDGAPVPTLSATPSIATSTIGRVEIGEVGANRSYTLVFDDVSADPPATTDPPPATPTGLRATAIPGGGEELAWDDGPESDLAGYTVYRLDGVDWTTLGSPTQARFVDQGLDASTAYTYAVDAVDAAGQHSARSAPVSGTTLAADAPPISHVVIVYMENHSFDNVLGKLCAEVADGTIPDHPPCDGATTALRSDGSTVPLRQSPDVVPVVNHNVQAQQTSIDGGRMDGFDRISGCTAAKSYGCLTQFDPSQIPNLAALAETYVISDATFEFSTSPSWVGHLVLASANQDGFQGDNPTPSTFTSLRGPGWGCDSYDDAPWWNGTQTIMVPSCIPDRTGAGPYRTSPVPYVPTIFDRLDGAGLSWRLYASEGEDVSGGSAYGAAICPTFYECFGSSQRANWVPTAQAVPDAAAGKLPNVSIVVPTAEISQHNSYSMTEGDDWIGSVVSAIQSGPDWPSTAIFITYDDCGCFYDHVPPPQAGWGIRVPMVIVSPYAVPGATDSSPATYSSMLAYPEHLFGLAPLASTDANAYDYGGSFDYAQTPQAAPVPMVRRGISEAERDWIQAHPAGEDDPT